MQPFMGITGNGAWIDQPDGIVVQADPTMPVKEKSWLRKRVEWLNEGTGAAHQARRALAWAGGALLHATLIPIPAGRTAAEYARRFRAERRGLKYVANIKADSSKTPPARDFTFNVSTDRQALNHLTRYVIKDDVVWYRAINDNEGEWKPMPFTAGTRPVRVSVDGANLCVEDDEHRIHYRKVIREADRCEEEDGAYVYRYREKSERNNFKETWFTLPVLSGVMRNKLLKIDPETSRGWAISHRGQFNHFLEDAVKGHHEVSYGVTTLFVLEPSGETLAMFDPWKPQFVHIVIPTEQTSHSSVTAIAMSVAASHLATLGYKTATGPHGITTRRPCAQTALVDLDKLGWNPFLKFDYQQDPSDPSVRVLGPLIWLEHPLPDAAGDRITKHICILQTGEGNLARELRIYGSRDGETGFFFKRLKAQEWDFRAEPGLVLAEQDFLQLQTEILDEAPAYTAKDYYNAEAGLTLRDFTLETVSSTLEVAGFGEVMVYRRANLIKKAIGFEGEKFDIVLPQDASTQLRHRIKELFGDEEPRSIHLQSTDDGGVRIGRVHLVK